MNSLKRRGWILFFGTSINLFYAHFEGEDMQNILWVQVFCMRGLWQKAQLMNDTSAADKVCRGFYSLQTIWKPTEKTHHWSRWSFRSNYSYYSNYVSWFIGWMFCSKDIPRPDKTAVSVVKCRPSLTSCCLRAERNPVERPDSLIYSVPWGKWWSHQVKCKNARDTLSK